MLKKDILLISSPQTDFEEVEFIRKDALLEWINYKMSFEQGFESEYKSALEDLINAINDIR